MERINKKFLFLLLLIIFLSTAFVVKANKPLEQNYPTFLGKTITPDSTLIDLLLYLFYFAVLISGIAVFIMFVIAGVQWLTSAGNPGGIKAARDRMTSAIIGLILLFSSYLILNTINPQLTLLNLPGIGMGDVTAPNVEEGKIEEAEPPDDGVIFFQYVNFKGKTSTLMVSESPKTNLPEQACWDDTWDLTADPPQTCESDGTHVADNSFSGFVTGASIDHLILCSHEEVDADEIDDGAVKAGGVWCRYFDQKIVPDLRKFDCLRSRGSNPSGYELKDCNNMTSAAMVTNGPMIGKCQGATVFPESPYDAEDGPGGGVFYLPGQHNICCHDSNDSEFCSTNEGINVIKCKPPRYNCGDSDVYGCVSSISIEGGCTVVLYPDANCSSDAILTTPIAESKNLNELLKPGGAPDETWDEQVKCIEIVSTNP